MKDKLRVNFLALKRLIRRNKEKAIAITTAAVLTGGIVIGAVIKKHEKDIIEPSSSYTDEIIGPKQDDEVVSVNTTTYGTYLTDLQLPLNGSSFALVPFEITYSDTGVLISKSIYEEYSKYAEDNKVEIGYMFNPTSTDRASMYLAIKELKDVISNYDVNYPIIYNVDCLYNNHNETDREYNYSILKSFIDKMNENKCYVMIAGSKESLDDMENRFNNHSESGIDYKQIDKLVFGDVELKDDICMKLVDNKIESRFNYTAFIDSYGYNDSNHFVDDYTHIVKPGDTLPGIAALYDFNEYNIMKYNNKYEYKTLYNGQQLDIPTYRVKVNQLYSIRDYDYKAEETVDSIVSINGTYIKDKEVNFNLDNTSFALIEYTNIFDDKGNKTYMSGNYAFSKCSDANVPFGIVYSPNGARLSDVYCSIRNLKRFMKSYDTKYPVLYNVDAIFESENEDKYNYDLSKAFVERMQYDGCYVGFIGKQSNIEKLKKLYKNNNDLDTFNKFMVALKLNTNEEVTLMSNVGLYVYNGSNIVAKRDFEGAIKSKNLNNSINFKDDYSYIVQEGDTLDSISKKFNLKAWNIKMYNKQYDLTSGVKAGQTLYFPNVFELAHNDKLDNNLSNLPNIQIDSDGKYFVGIDVSDNQGKINWEEVAPHIDYAIIKFGNGWFFKGLGGYQGEDRAIESTFKYNYSECKRLGIPVGLYVFSNYYVEDNGTNYNYQDEAKIEAEYVAKYLRDNGYTLELPLYMDYEPRTSGSMYENATPEIMADIIRIQKETIENYGYYYGLYTGESFYNTTIKNLNVGIETWLAHYPSRDAVTPDILRKSNPTCANMESDYVNNNQISSDGSIPGIKKRVDVNIADQQLIDNCNEFYKRLN
jgi:GH25 family lysozyme M1 (1,4-beta-N-acetylmuramidase)/murein DD-endopeptidase MepM/ murein hydrolase activator NlpD